MESYKSQSAEYVYGFVKNVIETTGPRLPGSEEEARAASLIAEEMEKATGSKAVIEPFKVAPVASIGAISLLGIAALIATAVFFVSPLIGLILSFMILMYAILQIFTYTGIFDFLWKQHTSHNVYSEVLPEDGKYDYTIMFSGHNDSSWHWNHSMKNPDTALIKIGLGMLGLIVMIVTGIIQVAKGNLFVWNSAKDIGTIILYCLPILTIPGSYFIATYLTWNKAMASPGAMDNLTGVGFSILMAKYFSENKDKMPKNCRIICAGLGSEEAGLKGSMAFVKKHKDEEWLKNTYVINLDSIRDYEHFNVVKGDLWLGSRFDQDMVDMAVAAMKEAGRKGGVIINPVGGCDSTPFHRIGVKTTTLIAQNPTTTDYYHTCKDVYEDLDMRTLADFSEVLLKLTDKVAAYHNKSK